MSLRLSVLIPCIVALVLGVGGPILARLQSERAKEAREREEDWLEKHMIEACKRDIAVLAAFKEKRIAEEYAAVQPRMVALLGQADALLKQERFDEAARTYDLAEELIPEDAVPDEKWVGLQLRKLNTLNRKCIPLFASGNYARAIEILKEATRFYELRLPHGHMEMSQGLLFLGACQLKNGEADEALASWHRSIVNASAFPKTAPERFSRFKNSAVDDYTKRLKALGWKDERIVAELSKINEEAMALRTQEDTMSLETRKGQIARSESESSVK